MREFFLSWFGGVGQRVCFVFFRDEEWALTMDIFFFVVFFFRRPSSASIDAHSLLSFFLFSPPLSLSPLTTTTSQRIKF
jgi:hypothetical protein